MEIVMRVYFEKPCTTIGWKGLINLGLSSSKAAAPVIPQYIADVIAWTAVGARTTESQTH